MYLRLRVGDEGNLKHKAEIFFEGGGAQFFQLDLNLMKQHKKFH